MSGSITEDVLLLPVAAAGVAAVAVGVVAMTAIGVVGGVAGTLVNTGQNLAEGISEVLNQMQLENQERLRLEQEWITKLRAEREQAFNNLNAYITSLVELSKTDDRLENCANVPGAAEQRNSLLAKRETKAQQIRQLRDKAMRSNDVDEIEMYAAEAQKLFESLQVELQGEIIFFAKNGIELKEYGSLNEDAVRIALAKKNATENVRLFSVDEVQNGAMTETMFKHDLIVFQDALSEILCEEGLNDRHLRDLMAIKQDLKKIASDESTSLEIKKKRLATLFTTFCKREKGIRAELEEMSKYYDDYLRVTFDIPEERCALSDFDSLEEIVEETKQALKEREERLKKQYIQIQMDRVMKKNGLNVVESAVMGRKEDDPRVLYGIDSKAAVDVFISDQGMVTTRVVGINFGENPTEHDEDSLVETEHEFCSRMTQIEADLEGFGIVLRRKRTLPPDRTLAKWIQLDGNVTEKKANTIKKRKRRTDKKVMYME